MFKNRKFHFALIPTIAYIAFMVLLLSLCRWQYNKSFLKQELFDAFESGATKTMSLTDALRGDPLYQRVSVSGRFDTERSYLLDNMVNSESVPGSHVYTPFRTSQGQTIIVNRGWIGRRSQDEPLQSLQSFVATPSEQVTITGRLDTLRSPGLVLKAEIPRGEYPKTVQFPTFAQLEADLNTKLVDHQLLLDATDFAEFGFLREWKPNTLGPATHLGYAFQWFALALTLTIIYLVLSFRKLTPSQASDEE